MAVVQAPDPIASVYAALRGVPAETLTKAWWHLQCDGSPRQRTVSEMRDHRRRLGAGGNCFDLALWVLDDLLDAGVAARAIGHHWETPEAHIAVVAESGGAEYLCDLGDQWLQPVVISPGATRFSGDWLVGFFPGAEVRIARQADQLTVHYRFPDGRTNRQIYDLSPTPPLALDRACRHSQNLLRKALVEVIATHPETGEVGAWEFDRNRSFWRLGSGHRHEEPCAGADAWTERICQRTGMSPAVVACALEMYGV